MVALTVFLFPLREGSIAYFSFSFFPFFMQDRTAAPDMCRNASLLQHQCLFIFFCGGLRDISRFGICGDCLKTNTSLNESPCDLVLYFSEEISLSSSLMSSRPISLSLPNLPQQGSNKESWGCLL